jgi:O-succinylbenzoic acid--CoA ligase
MAIVVETSGSSGVPKRVIISEEAIRASTDAAIERLGGPGQWVLALPEQYIAGKNVIWRNEASGAPLVRTEGAFTA